MVSLVTNSGLANVMAAWSAYASRPQYIQCGSGLGQTAASNDLASAVETRVAGTTSLETENVTGDTLRITGTITATANETISEVGVFDASSAGNMDIYGDFTGIDLVNGDSIVFQVNVTAT
jgi:hypothetical protein